MCIKLTTEGFIEKAKTIHNEKYDYSQVTYVGITHKVNIICKHHGVFTQTANHHLLGSGCKKCWAKSKTLTTEGFIEKAKTIHNEKYDYSQVKYTETHNKVNIICKHHGIFTQNPNNHLQGKGCTKCGSDRQRKTTEGFIEKAKMIHNEKYDYSLVKYTNTHNKVNIICKKHGLFKQKPHSHLTGQGCSKCANVVSYKESKWLDALNLPNDHKHRQVFFRIKGKKIKVDGFEPTTNTIYEFWGDFWHGNPAKYNSNEINTISKKSFGQLFEETKQKRQLIIESGFNLVEIWESEFALK